MSEQTTLDQLMSVQSMQDQIVLSQPVTVSFDPAASPQFQFVPSRVPMKGAGRVLFKRNRADAEWTFIVGIVKNDSAEQFSSAVRGQGTILHIHDEYRELGEYSYMIMVELHGQYYLSPDPVIVNEPPG